MAHESVPTFIENSYEYITRKLFLNFVSISQRYLNSRLSIASIGFDIQELPFISVNYVFYDSYSRYISY